MQGADFSSFSCLIYAGDTSRRIFRSHSWNISRIEKQQKSETIGLMNENFKSSTFGLTASDTCSFSYSAVHDNYSCSTKARNNYPAWHYL